MSKYRYSCIHCHEPVVGFVYPHAWGSILVDHMNGFCNLHGDKVITWSDYHFGPHYTLYTVKEAQIIELLNE